MINILINNQNYSKNSLNNNNFFYNEKILQIIYNKLKKLYIN